MREIMIYGPIDRDGGPGTVSARGVVAELERLARTPGDIHLRIHSPGGDVGEGIAIYNAVQKVADRVVATVEGIAYSMASVIALAGREVRAFEVAQVMIHDPALAVTGGIRELEAALGALRTARGSLVAAYTRKTGKPEEEILCLMNKTTFFNAAEAKALGLVDVVLGARSMPVAAFDATAWAEYHAGRGPLPVRMAAQGDGPATVAEVKAACPSAGDAFIVKALESGWTVAQAQAEHTKELTAELATVRAELAQVRAAQGAGTPRPGVSLGVAALADGAGNGGAAHLDAKAAWDEAMAERVGKGMTRAKAVADIARTAPDVRAAYVEACNAR